MAPPTCFTGSSADLAQLAISPFSATSNAPSTHKSRWPPRAMAKLSSWCTYDPPVRSVTCVVLALIRNGLTASAAGAGPTPITPFSAWKMTSRSDGTKSATSVGMPMPRLTSQPSGMSCAHHAAMPLRSSGVNAIEALSERHVQHAVHEDAGRDDGLRRKFPKSDDIARHRDGELRSHCHHRIEVSRTVAVGQIAPAIRLPCLDKRNVTWQRIFQQA